MPPRLQEGIYHGPGRRPGKFFSILFLRATAGAGAAAVADSFSELWAMYGELKDGRLRDLEGTPVPSEEDHLEVLVGFGTKVFDLEGAGAERPFGLGPRSRFRSAEPSGGGPLLAGSGLSYAPDLRANLATEELCVQFVADTQLAVHRPIVETWKLLSDSVEPGGAEPALGVSTFYLGFQREDHRSWIDFHDGLSNLRSEDRESVVAIEPGTDVAWVTGGTYLVFLRLAVDLPGWRAVSRRDQELAVGRDKLTGCPLIEAGEGGLAADPACPVSGTQIWQSENDARFAEPPRLSDEQLLRSHVQRANHHGLPASDPTNRRIFRQGYEFLEWQESRPGFRVGLNFVSFQDTPDRVLGMLTAGGWLGNTNFGGDEEGIPGLTALLSVYAAAVYLVPPLQEGESFPGSSALASAPEVAATEPGGR
jgi:deferrochelatase/peroxidase EfeB